MMAFVTCDCCGKQVHICVGCANWMPREKNVLHPKSKIKPADSISPKFSVSIIKKTKVTHEMSKRIKALRAEKGISWYLAKREVMQNMGLNPTNRAYHLNRSFREGTKLPRDATAEAVEE
jgi:hypothetical protein